MTSYSSVDPVEIDKFSKIADEWWNPNGKFKPLHLINPVRLEFITSNVAQHFNKAIAGAYLEGLEILDIGCGGGLLCEPMARLGANVTGIDASERNIQVASIHAENSGLGIHYRSATVEQLVKEGKTFDVILNTEVIEHVATPEQFISDCCKLLKPNGVMIVTTINRTAKSFGFAIVGAEYLLRWLPRGTHDWNKFVKPSEISKWLRASGIKIKDTKGMSFNPISSEWKLSDDIDVNYLMFCTK